MLVLKRIFIQTEIVRIGMTSQSQLLLKAKGYHNTLMDNFIQIFLPDAQRTALIIQVISYEKTGAQYRDKC